MAWIDVIIVWFLCGIIAGFIGHWRRVGFVLHCLIGVLFGPIGILTAFLFRPTDEERYRSNATSSGLKKCPYCAEFVKFEAKLCKHCKSSLPNTVANEQSHPLGSGLGKNEQAQASRTVVSQSAETEIYSLYQIRKYPDHCMVEEKRFATVEEAKSWIDQAK